MACPRRFLVVFLGFLGLLLSIGYRAVFAMVMVHVIKQPSNHTDSEESIFKNVSNSYKLSVVLYLRWRMNNTFNAKFS